MCVSDDPRGEAQHERAELERELARLEREPLTEDEFVINYILSLQTN